MTTKKSSSLPKRAPPLILPSITPHTANDMALLPLLEPFSISKPQTSPLIIALINERHAGDTVDGLIELEERLYEDIRKANSNNGDEKDGTCDTDKNKTKTANGSGTSSTSGNTTGKKSKKSKKNSKNNSKSDPNGMYILDLETQVATVSHHLFQSREHYEHQSLLARATVQGHYTLVASTLERRADSRDAKEAKEAKEKLERLEEAYEYLSDCERRNVYMREMIPVMKKVGSVASVGNGNVVFSIEAIRALPFIQMFQCVSLVESGGKQMVSSPICASLLLELHQSTLTQELRTRLKDELANSAPLRRLLKDQSDLSSKISFRTTEMIRKHYRKKSIQLHPDRNGESFRQQFEEFTRAKDLLVEEELRKKYCNEMMEVYRNFGVGVMMKSHESWVKKHLSDKVEDGSGLKKSQGKGGKGGRRDEEGKGGDGAGGGGAEEPLRLEGGLHQQTPKGPMIQHRQEGKMNHYASVSIHALKPIYEFYARVRSIQVTFTSTNNDFLTLTIERDQIVKHLKYDRYTGLELPSLLPVGEELLSPGNWEVTYHCALDTISTDPISPKNATEDSADTTVHTKDSPIAFFHVKDREYERRVAGLAKSEESCKIVKAELVNVLHKLKTQWDAAGNKSPALDRYGYYHQVLVRAGKKYRNLKRAMEETGKQSDVCDSLGKLLEESRKVFAQRQMQMDSALKRREKKDKVKQFKTFIAEILESEDPVTWMKKVTEEELQEEGGDSNRLYQLFIEGKGKYVLLVASDMYLAASEREDLFSSKQCSDLKSRGQTVAVQEKIEEEEQMAAEAKRKAEEEERDKLQKEAELKRKWALVGNNVTIRGLTSDKGKSLNSSIARVVYYNIDKDRFEVECLDSGEKAYLKEGNLNVYHGKGRPPQSARPRAKPAVVDQWTCSRCTFENGAKKNACSMCLTPRWKEGDPGNSKEEKKEEDDKINTVESLSNKATSMSTSTAGNPKQNIKTISETTVYVASTHAKLLTGKKGKKKKELMTKSGATNIHVGTQISGGHVPVHMTGDDASVQKAITLILEAVGPDNVSLLKVYDTKNESTDPPKAVTQPPNDNAPSYEKGPSPEPVDETSVVVTHANLPASGFDSLPGINETISSPVNSGTIPETTDYETKTISQHSFGDALLPQGLMEMATESYDEMPKELPLEIGIKKDMFPCSGTARESITEASVSSLNDRSHGSRTDFSLPHNDPLLAFLRSEDVKACIKGSVEEFYTWLVKSEDIDSMDALKEAVADEDYINESLKAGNGNVGLKGFKRKAFQRAVTSYREGNATDTVGTLAKPDFSTPALNNPSLSNNSPSLSNPIGMNGIGHIGIGGLGSSAFLPSNLFGGNDVQQSEEAPSELFCPIDMVLMTEDPVLAADGVTYSRSAIEKWFQTNILKINSAQEKLKLNPHLPHEQEVVRNGIRSPMYGTQLPNLSLTPNTSIKNMARAYKLRLEQSGNSIGAEAGGFGMSPFFRNGQLNNV